ncbi:DMT family transporter, partial [Streptomyces althioticus]
SLDGPQRVAAAVATAAAVVTLMVAARAVHRHPAVRSILLATAAGVAFGMSSVFTKTVAVDWTGGVSAGDLPSLAVIGVLATAGMLLSQASYRGAGLAAPLATLTVVNPVVAAAVGITMFGETFRYGTTGTALALSCGVVAAGGLILLTTERLAREGAAGAAVPVETRAVPAPVTTAGREAEDAAAELLLAELTVPEDVTLPEDVLSPATVPSAAAGPDALDPAAVPVMPYAPFYGGPYVPVPVGDRRLARARP